MRCRNRWFVVAGLMVFAIVVTTAQSRTDRLVIGEQKTFRPGYAVGDIAIANPDVCDYRVIAGRREVMLIANGQGFTTLTIWDQRGVKRDEIGIEVVSREFAKVQADLADLLRPYPGVVIKPLGNRAVITGTVNTPEDLEMVRTLAAAASDTLCTVTVAAARGSGSGSGSAAADPPGAEPAAAPTIRRVPVRQGEAPAAEPGHAAGDVEYLIEVYESPLSAPPPEVAGPQGRRLYSGRVRTDRGIEVRQSVSLQVKGLPGTKTVSLSLTPSTRSAGIETALVVDTDLPLGPGDPAKSSAWFRATLTFGLRAGQTRYVRENDLATSARAAGNAARQSAIVIAISPAIVGAPRDAASARPSPARPGGE